MDKLTFITELVKAMAWPITTLALVLTLRRPLLNLVSLLHRFKYKDFEFEFARKVEAAKAEAATVLGDAVRPETLPTLHESRLVQLAEISPRAAVLEAFTSVEIEAISAAHRLSMVKTFPPTLTFRAMKFLEDSGRMDPALIDLLRHLRALRNQAAHAPEFALTTDAAVQYIQLAQAAIEKLRAIDGA
jgi:hypothetical protein